MTKHAVRRLLDIEAQLETTQPESLPPMPLPIGKQNQEWFHKYGAYASPNIQRLISAGTSEEQAIKIQQSLKNRDHHMSLAEIENHKVSHTKQTNEGIRQETSKTKKKDNPKNRQPKIKIARKG